MKLQEIADHICNHLQRFEADPVINPTNEHGTKPYYWACAVARGPKIFVTYVSYQGPSSLSKAEALQYLEWLDAGNIGEHYRLR